MKFVKLLCFFFGFLAFAQSAFSQATLSVQGVIKNSDGTAVDNGKYSLTFKLYETESGGSPVWSETQDNVQVTGGIYSALLGATTPMTAAFNTTYFLGLSVEGGAELIPRAKLTSSPYALSLIGTGNIFPSSGAIGAGTAAPTAGYQIHAKSTDSAGKILVEGSTAAQVQLKKGTATATVGFGTSNNELVVNPGANNTTLQYDGSTKLTVNTNGVAVTGTLSTGALSMTNDLNLASGKTVSYNGLNDWRLVDTDDFETDNEGWVCHDGVNNSTSVASNRVQFDGTVNSGYSLRPSVNGNDVLKKQFNLTGIPHTKVKVVFTYHFLDTWDSNGENEHAFAGFANSSAPTTSTGQFMVCWMTRPMYGHGTEYLTTYINSGTWDFNSRQEMVIQNSNDNIWVIIGSTLNTAANDESYAIDNIEIWVK